MEYTVWGVLQEMVYQCRSFKYVQELQSVIVAAWQQLSQAFLERSISEWRRRLENVVQCKALYTLATKSTATFCHQSTGDKIGTVDFVAGAVDEIDRMWACHYSSHVT